MKNLTLVLMAVLVSACNQDGTLTGTGSSQSSSQAAVSSCNISSMMTNGQHSADVSRSAYQCRFDDDDSYINFVFHTDTGTYVFYHNETPVQNLWFKDEANCRIGVRLFDFQNLNSTKLYYLNDIVLNSNSQLQQGTLTDTTQGTVRTFSRCYYDTTPGF